MIFTIGTSNRSLPEFLNELQRRHITQLVDVRSSPYSRLAWFNAPQIARWAERAGIMYRQEGPVLGGRSDVRPSDPRFVAALNRLAEAAEREPLAIFCAEGDPEHCHRSWAIGASILSILGIDLVNIRRNGTEELMTVTLGRIRASPGLA